MIRLRSPLLPLAVRAALGLALLVAAPVAAAAEARAKAPPAALQLAANAAQKPAAKKPARKPAARKSRNPHSDLDKLKQEIRSTERRVQLTREQRQQKEAELRQAEIEIGSLRGSVLEVRREVAQREQRLAALRAEKAQQQQSRDRLTNQIRADLQMAQRQGGQDYYKLLLNQENPQTLSRLMKYYGYLQQARSQRVESLNAALARLDTIARDEAQTLEQLQAMRSELEQKQGRLSAAQRQRTEAIRTLSAQLESEDEKLRRLRRDEQALQAVVERLAREAAARERQARAAREKARQEAERRRQESAAAAPPASGRPVPPPPPAAEEEADVVLTPYQGRCPLPVAGGLRAQFGSPRAGGLRWNGILIAAEAGTPVRAVRPGRVAFADYLRGYGLLMIIDHGRGLMSLYGHNQRLKKKAGDDVAGNEVIAEVGDSGGNETEGLYFEIRVRGRPSDPASWCGYK